MVKRRESKNVKTEKKNQMENGEERLYGKGEEENRRKKWKKK